MSTTQDDAGYELERLLGSGAVGVVDCASPRRVEPAADADEAPR